MTKKEIQNHCYGALQDLGGSFDTQGSHKVVLCDKLFMLRRMNPAILYCMGFGYSKAAAEFAVAEYLAWKEWVCEAEDSRRLGKWEMWESARIRLGFSSTWWTLGN